jgi:hypothetical protein
LRWFLHRLISGLFGTKKGTAHTSRNHPEKRKLLARAEIILKTMAAAIRA